MLVGADVEAHAVRPGLAIEVVAAKIEFDTSIGAVHVTPVPLLTTVLNVNTAGLGSALVAGALDHRRQVVATHDQRVR